MVGLHRGATLCLVSGFVHNGPAQYVAQVMWFGLVWRCCIAGVALMCAMVGGSPSAMCRMSMHLVCLFVVFVKNVWVSCWRCGFVCDVPERCSWVLLVFWCLSCYDGFWSCLVVRVFDVGLCGGCGAMFVYVVWLCGVMRCCICLGSAGAWFCRAGRGRADQILLFLVS